MDADLRAVLVEHLTTLVDNSVDCLRKTAVGVAPTDTGQLAETAKITRTGPLSIRLSFSTPQAVFTDSGTRPHEIRPSNKKALFWDGARHPVAKVNHPGSQKHKDWFSGRDWADDWGTCLA